MCGEINALSLLSEWACHRCECILMEACDKMKLYEYIIGFHHPQPLFEEQFPPNFCSIWLNDAIELLLSLKTLKLSHFSRSRCQWICVSDSQNSSNSDDNPRVKLTYGKKKDRFIVFVYVAVVSINFTILVRSEIIVSEKTVMAFHECFCCVWFNLKSC